MGSVLVVILRDYVLDYGLYRKQATRQEIWNFYHTKRQTHYRCEHGPSKENMTASNTAHSFSITPMETINSISVIFFHIEYSFEIKNCVNDVSVPYLSFALLIGLRFRLGPFIGPSIALAFS